MPLRSIARLTLALALAATGGLAQAAEIVLQESAVLQLVKQALFTQQGRYVLRPGPCHATLAEPSVTVQGGRVRIRSRLSSNTGVEVGDQCVGVPMAAWTVVSGVPVPRDGVVRLENIRIDDVEDETARLALQSGLAPRLPRAVEIDVRGSVAEMLHGWKSAGVQSTLEAFAIQSVEAEGGRLAVRFDFRIGAR